MKSWREISGILLLDKPQGLSSNQALQKARHLFNARKAGHTGSLDPLATGLLPICFGEATKIAGYLLGARKAYVAQCRLGVTTSTDDADGEVEQTRPVPALDAEAIEAAMAPLRGRIAQTPPIYSALKQAGVPLYKRARRGEDVQAPAREVEVFRFDLLERDGEVLRLQVECGSGTYVRSLVRDLGETLGCGAHLTGLRRTWIEPFTQPRMQTLESLVQQLEQHGLDGLDGLLLPLEQGLRSRACVAAWTRRRRCSCAMASAWSYRMRRPSRFAARWTRPADWSPWSKSGRAARSISGAASIRVRNSDELAGFCGLVPGNFPRRHKTRYNRRLISLEIANANNCVACGMASPLSPDP